MRFTVKIFIRKDRMQDDGRAPLYLQVFINGLRGRIPLGLFVEPEYWSESEQMVSRTLPNDKKSDAKGKKASDLNLMIRDSLSRANDIFVEYRLKGLELNPDMFKEEFNNPSATEDFIEFYARELENRKKKKIITDRTYQVEKTSLTKLRQYKGRIFFNAITPRLLEDFDAWMKRELNNGLNTRWGALKNVRTYYYIALHSGRFHKLQNPFLQYKLKRQKGKVTYLDKAEIVKLEGILENKGYTTDEGVWIPLPTHLTPTLRAFLGSCFTGLRISDVQKLDSLSIVNDTIVFIPKKTRRTEKLVRIPLSERAKKYLNIEEGKRLFQTHTDQVMNRHLKEIAFMAGIPKKLTFHVARHSFACLFLELGGSVEVLQELLGHSDLDTTMIYVHINEQRKRDQMGNFDKF